MRAERGERQRGDGWGESSEGEDPLPVLQPRTRAAVGSRGRGAAPILGAARPRCSRAGAVGVRLRLAPCPCPAPGAAPRAGGGRGRHWGGGEQRRLERLGLGCDERAAV